MGKRNLTAARQKENAMNLNALALVWRGKAFALLLIAVMLWAMPTAAKTDVSCTFEVPKDWQPADTRWHGACLKGRADGLGVLRHLSGSKVDRVFYGRLKSGVPSLGVIEIDGGFIAGEFRDGVVADSQDRNIIIRAFDEASKAAKSAASRFERDGNKASATHYRERAKALANQMD
jgi:hypothetical protein